MKIEKIDAHHHLWSLASTHHPMLRAPDTERFFGNTGGLKRDFAAAEFLPMAAAQNVTRSVYVESHFDPPIEETAAIDAFAAAHGFPHAIVGRVDLTNEQLGNDLDVHQRSPLFRGVRAMVNWDADPILRATNDPHLLRDSAWRAGYAELGRRGLSMEVMALPAQLRDLADVAAAHPDTPLIVGHAGLPLRGDAAEERAWREGMAALAAIPHVVVKISGLGMVDHHWTADSIRPIVRELIALFTPGRAMFGSNFPVDALHASYDRVWDTFDAITADYPAADRAALFCDTAARVYRIG